MCRAFFRLSDLSHVNRRGAVLREVLPQTLTTGEVASAVKVPGEVDASKVLNVSVPVAFGATAPGPWPAFDPYAIVQFFAAASVTRFTSMVDPETATVPHVDVTYPAALAVVDGADHPEATTTAIAPSVGSPGTELEFAL